MGVEFGNCLNTNTFANTNAIENRDKCKIHNCFRKLSQFQMHWLVCRLFSNMRGVQCSPGSVGRRRQLSFYDGFGY